MKLSVAELAMMPDTRNQVWDERQRVWQVLYEHEDELPAIVRLKLAAICNGEDFPITKGETNVTG